MARPDLEEWADAFYLGKHGFAKRKTFGCPSYYRGKKMAAFLYEDALSIKLAPERVLEKIAENADSYAPFRPADGVMHNWLLLTLPEAGDYDGERPLLEEGIISV